MQGEGTYTYKKSGDIYSGTWNCNKKNGQGSYQFGADSSVMEGTWENNQIMHGKWVLQGAAVYEGQFKQGRPFGPGSFSFASGLKQTGSYEEKKPVEGEEEEENVDEEGNPLPPKVMWKGNSIVSF